MRSANTISRTNLCSLTCLAVLAATPLFAATTAEKILESTDNKSGLIVVLGCGDPASPELAAALGQNGNWLVHAIASDAKELNKFNKAIAEAKVKGCVSSEVLEMTKLPYRDYLVNVMVIMDMEKAKAAGLKMEEVNRCVAPQGKIVICSKGRITDTTDAPPHKAMDVWTHRYHGADGVPASKDKVFDLPVGFKWNAGLPMNFDNPTRSANRYSSTRALLVDDGRCFTFSTAVYENLGDGWTSKYGTDQYLTCRDAFNGRMMWRKRIGDTYYGGLYIENTAPMVSTGRRLYLAGENGKMLVVDTRTGETVRELPTENIPGVIATAEGTVVVATWKNGKQMGSVKRYDRRRMDWEIGEGTVEAYDDKTGKLLWKNKLLGTSMVIADGSVYVVNRDAVDPLEKNHNRGAKGVVIKHPPQKVIAMNLVDGEVRWETTAKEFNAVNQALSLEAAGHGAVAVGLQGRGKVAILSAETGKLPDSATSREASKNFFRYRNHICTPSMRVGDVVLSNRGGSIRKGKENVKFAGARAACLSGTVPAYGAGYIAQNWCRCSPGQIPGLLAVAPIGNELTPAEMEAPTQPIVYDKYNDAKDGIASPSKWTSFRGNAERSSSSACDVPTEIEIAWSKKIVAERKDGTLQRDWRSFLNTRLTAASISGGSGGSGGLAVVGDIDHNELIAIDVNDGSLRWRFMTAGRMDTAPTLHKGICLISDRTGHVYALKTNSGKLIYKLRIAPEEKRMLSYGKVESVWPVIGGVMIVDGKAFATAGRSQGSDGGLVVRSFEPETGKHLWSKALPQFSKEFTEKKPKRNDILVRHGDHLTIMGHWLNLANGRVSPKPKAEPQDRAVTVGLEGFHSWNWTRLGHRKFMAIGFGEFKGDTVSWNDKYVATTNRNGGLISSIGETKKRTGIAGPRTFQTTSLVVSNNLVIQGGAILDHEKDHGFVRAVDLDGKVVWEKTFEAKLAFNGLAVDSCGIIATFDDGTIVCLK